MAKDKFITRIITIFFLGILILLGFMILKNILISIVIGLLFSYIFNPVYKKINKKIPSKDFSAIILILGVVFIIAIPLWFLIPVILRQGIDAFFLLQGVNYTEILSRISPTIFSEELSRMISTQLNNIVSHTMTSLLNQLTNILVKIPNLLLQIAVVLFTFYFSVRDSDSLKKYVSDLSPFTESTEKKFLLEFRNITNAIVYGQVLIGIIQGIALGIGLWILGVPSAILFTVLGAIASIIPVIGAWIIWLPVGIYLLANAQIFAGIALILYGAIFVSSIDNILRPFFLSRNTNLPMSVALIGTIGGLYYFGITGLVLGPLILAYLLIIIEFYKEGKLNDLFKE